MRRWVLRIFLSLVFLAVGAAVGYKLGKINSRFPVEIGVTTCDEYLEQNPNARALIVASGYGTMDSLDDRLGINVDFTYKDGDFVATKYEVYEKVKTKE